MTREELVTIFPAFDEIADKDLRSRSLDAMLLAVEKGGWSKETLPLCPVTLNWKNCKVSWIEHVSDVVATCLAAYEKTAKYYRQNGVAFDRDIIAAGALLHDIGKLTEFTVKDGIACHSDNYQLLRHPLSGAILAAQAGLPDKIVHLIATHSFEGDASYQTPESRFVRSLDIFVFKCSVEGLPKNM